MKNRFKMFTMSAGVAVGIVLTTITTHAAPVDETGITNMIWDTVGPYFNIATVLASVAAVFSIISLGFSYLFKKPEEREMTGFVTSMITVLIIATIILSARALVKLFGIG